MNYFSVDSTTPVARKPESPVNVAGFVPRIPGQEDKPQEPVEVIPTTVSPVTEPSAVEETTLPVFVCDHSMFLCEDGSDCLTQEAVCNGVQDCLDNTDEVNCTKPGMIKNLNAIISQSRINNLVG